MKKIDVILASYNGSEFIGEQIHSIIINFNALADYDCHLLISDDSSTDGTVSIIEGFKKLDERILFLGSERKGGVKNNFENLIMSTSADYIFFCDQDDFWLPSKMRIFMQEFESLQNDNHLPLLLHSDLCVADKNLSPIHASMFEYQNIRKRPSFTNVLISNSVTGCVMAINKKMIDLIKYSNIKESIMHDWYIALIASSFGRIHYIDSSLILYRQHGRNQVGAKSFSFYSFINNGGFIKKILDSRESIIKTKEQANVFLDDFFDDLDKEKRDILKLYIESFRMIFLKRLYFFLFKDFKKKGFSRSFVFFFLYVFPNNKINN